MKEIRGTQDASSFLTLFYLTFHFFFFFFCLCEKALMRSDPWPWHVPADVVECDSDSEGHVLPDWSLRRWGAPGTLAACDYLHAGGTLRLLFSPQHQTSPIKPIPRFAVEDTAPGTPAISWHQDRRAVNEQHILPPQLRCHIRTMDSCWSRRSCAAF